MSKGKIGRLRLKSSRIKAYVIIAILLMIYTSGSIYNVINYQYNEVMKIATGAFLLLGTVRLRRNDYRKLGIVLLIIIALIPVNLISGGVLGVFLTTAFRIISVFAFYLYCHRNRIDILKIMYQIFVVGACFYLVCWILFDIGPLMGRGRIIVVNETAFTNYFNIYYRWHDLRRIFGFMFNSCNGPFSEPGLYMIWLSFGLIYELFIKPQRNYLITALFVISLISTTSTMGALMLSAIIAVYLYYNSGKRIRIIGLIPIGFVTVYAFYRIWNERINSRIESVTGRLGDISVMFEGIVKHPLFGNGIGNIDTTNSFFLYIYDFGLLGLGIMVLWIRNLIKSKRNIQIKIVVVIWATLSMFNEPVGYYNLFIFAMICLYDYFKDYNHIKMVIST